MNPVGKWKVKEVISFNENFEMVWKTIDELAASASEDDDNSVSVYQNSITVFNDNGTVETIMPIPEGATAEELEDVEIRDGMAVIDTKQWKNEDGKNLYNSEIQGEVLGEEVSPWIEIKEVGDMIELESIRLARIEE
ncbi:MAG: hypothetical protein MR364_04905 [Oscillospiraceae bacterium]|nr:hypothetical protein [Oscillospiraceae bacterium]